MSDRKFHDLPKILSTHTKIFDDRFFVSNAIIPSYLKTNNLLLFFVTAGAGAPAVHHSSCDSQEPLQARR